MKGKDYFEYSLRTRIVSGGEALKRLPDVLSSLGVKNPLVITDPGVAGAGLLALLLEHLEMEGLPEIFDQVPPDSDREVVNRVASLFKEKNCDGILALGGGSVLDTAKGVNLVVSLEVADLLEYAGAGAIRTPLKPLVALPTTSGMGSEVTLVAVIADHAIHRKMLFTSNQLQPDAAILDPRLTLTLPPAITAASAMDALCHACEAWYGLGKNPFSDAASREGIRLITAHLTTVMEKPDDKQGRLALARGAALAGAAFSNSMVGMAHSIGHSLGAVCGIPHAAAMAVLLPFAMEYNLPRAEARIADLLEPLTGYRATAGTTPRARALGAILAIRELNQELRRLTGRRHPTSLGEILTREGKPMLTGEQFAAVAETTLGDGSIIYNNCELSYGEILEVLEAAYQGCSLLN